jgi:hypothetical protein
MKEQRQAIQAAEAVEANLGEIESPQSRFIDAGFVSTGGRDVDWAGKFLNAAKAGIDVYHSTDNYQQQLRNQKTQGLASATNYINDTEARAEAQEVKAEDMSYFLMKEMETAVSQLGSDGESDDSLSRMYKETFMGAVQSKYNSMAVMSQSKARGEVRKQKTDEAFANVKDWDYSFDETQDDLKTYFSDREISGIWAKAKSGQLADVAVKFEKEFDDYNSLVTDTMRDISDDIKASGKSRNEWLEDNDPFDSTKEYSMGDVIEARILKSGIVNPIDAFDEVVRGALQQEGTDGVGVIAELNTTEGKALYKAVLNARAKIKGVKYKKDILGSISAGVGDVSTMLSTALTGVDSEDETLKEAVTSGVIQQTAQWFTSSMTDPDPVIRQESARLLSDFLIKNPDYQAKTLTPIANGFAAQWKGALDSNNPSDAIGILSEMSQTLWSTDTGTATREALLKASGSNFELAMKAYRVGILPEHIVEMARGNLPKVTQDDYKNAFGADSYGAVKAEYVSSAREHMPWASPKEVEDITKFAMDFDYFGIGFDKAAFFDVYGEGMSHRASSPKAEMQAGEQHQITDFFGGRIFTPKSGAWKQINAKDASQAGYTQGMLHHLFANSSTALTEEIITGLGMELEAKSYGKDGKAGDFFTLNYGEGITDDFQPIRIRRFGQNEWKLELTTEEWTDNVALIGDRQPFVGITISNDDLLQGMSRFDTHLQSISEASVEAAQAKAISAAKWEADKKKQRTSKPIPNIYEDVDIGGTIKDWWNGMTEEYVVEPNKSTFIPIMPYSK